MIKRIAIFSLLMVYMSTTVGFALTLHFCGTKVSNVRINQSVKKPCCTSESEAKPDKCCKDQDIKIKVSDQQYNIQSAKVPGVSNLDLFIVPSRIATLSSGSVHLISQLSYRGPPAPRGIPLTIQNCVFLI